MHDVLKSKNRAPSGAFLTCILIILRPQSTKTMSNTTQVLQKIPCLDLKGQHDQIKDEVFAAFERVYEKTAFSGGPFVEEFEQQFATYIGSKYAIGVNNGTTALHLAMLALGIGHGDEVIMPADTFIATARCACRLAYV